jgi:hypothetical protein
MYQRNVRPKAVRWQMHSGGQPQRWPAGLWRCSTNPTTVSLRRPSREGWGRLAAWSRIEKEREPSDLLSLRWPDRSAHLPCRSHSRGDPASKRAAQARESPLFATLLDSALVAIDAKYGRMVASGGWRGPQEIAADLVPLPLEEHSSSAVRSHPGRSPSPRATRAAGVFLASKVGQHNGPRRLRQSGVLLELRPSPRGRFDAYLAPTGAETGGSGGV